MPPLYLPRKSGKSGQNLWSQMVPQMDCHAHVPYTRTVRMDFAWEIRMAGNLCQFTKSVDLNFCGTFFLSEWQQCWALLQAGIPISSVSTCVCSTLPRFGRDKAYSIWEQVREQRSITTSSSCITGNHSLFRSKRCYSTRLPWLILERCSFMVF